MNYTLQIITSLNFEDISKVIDRLASDYGRKYTPDFIVHYSDVRVERCWELEEDGLILSNYSQDGGKSWSDKEFFISHVKEDGRVDYISNGKDSDNQEWQRFRMEQGERDFYNAWLNHIAAKILLD